jgi:hypothetical protein
MLHLKSVPSDAAALYSYCQGGMKYVSGTMMMLDIDLQGAQVSQSNMPTENQPSTVASRTTHIVAKLTSHSAQKLGCLPPTDHLVRQQPR